MTSSAGSASISSSVSESCRLLTEEHLLEGVGAEPETERLERDDLLGRDVAEVDLRAEVLDEPGLRALRRRLEDDVAELDRVDDLVDQPGAHLARRAIDACGTALTPFGDHLPGAGVELLPHPLDPLVGGEDDLGVLRADLAHDDEVLGQLGDQLELSLARQVDRPVRDLDVREAVLHEPAPILVELSPDNDGLEEGAPADDGGVERAVEGDLLLEVPGDVRRSPAEFDDVHVVAGRVEQALDVAQVEALVDDVREPLRPRLGRAGWHVEKTRFFRTCGKISRKRTIVIPAHFFSLVRKFS